MGKVKRKKLIKKKLSFDKMTFEDREKLRAQLKVERVYTKAFRTSQSFGAAGPVRHIPVEKYLQEKELTDC